MKMQKCVNKYIYPYLFPYAGHQVYAPRHFYYPSKCWPQINATRLYRSLTLDFHSRGDILLNKMSEYLLPCDVSLI